MNGRLPILLEQPVIPDAQGRRRRRESWGQDPRTFENRGSRPHFLYFSIFSLKRIFCFCIFQHFENKVAEIRVQT